MSLERDVETWLDANWDLAITVREWWHRLATAGYAYPGWPQGVGGCGASRADERAIVGVLASRGVVGPPMGGVGARLVAPTILDHGTPAQIDELVRAIGFGEAAWCQLFSEPGSGSDLASVGCRAVLDGDEWVVNGQKVWNSVADVADYGMLLARTDVDVPKHRGISFLLLDMHQPGVEVRPLRVMNGTRPFCEVFLTDARVPVVQMLGAAGAGWRVAQTTLSYERSSLGSGGPRGLYPALSGSRGDLDQMTGSIIERARTSRRSRMIGGAVPAAAMLDLARSYGVAGDPMVRQEVAGYWSHARVNAWLLRRIGAAGGRLTGADGSLAKMATSRICQESAAVSYRIVGTQGLLSGPGSPLNGELQAVALSSPGARLGGGSDEIQLNVLGERGLGLPREPGDDREVPYRELRVGTQAARPSSTV